MNDAIKDNATGIAIIPRFAKRNSFVVRCFPPVKAWYIPIAVDRINIIPNTAKSILPNFTFTFVTMLSLCNGMYIPIHNKNVMYATLKSPGKRLIAVNLGLQQNTDPGSTDPPY